MSSSKNEHSPGASVLVPVSSEPIHWNETNCQYLNCHKWCLHFLTSSQALPPTLASGIKHCFVLSKEYHRLNIKKGVCSMLQYLCIIKEKSCYITSTLKRKPSEHTEVAWYFLECKPFFSLIITNEGLTNQLTSSNRIWQLLLVKQNCA